jgi:hypothetical protein
MEISRANKQVYQDKSGFDWTKFTLDDFFSLLLSLKSFVHKFSTDNNQKRIIKLNKRIKIKENAKTW